MHHPNWLAVRAIPKVPKRAYLLLKRNKRTQLAFPQEVIVIPALLCANVKCGAAGVRRITFQRIDEDFIPRVHRVHSFHIPFLILCSLPRHCHVSPLRRTFWR